MVKERYLINEAAKEVHVESHVLRYWEEELGLPIKRNEQGHRIYTQEDVDRFIRIKDWKDQGLQLKAVRTLLGQSPEERRENPFAQKQLTKIGKNGDMKVIQLKSGDELKWKELKSERHMTEGKEQRRENADRQELAIQIKDMEGTRADDAALSVQDETQKEQMVRLQYLFQKLIKEVVTENNEAMVNDISQKVTGTIREDLCKELDYQFRLLEEREEQRETAKKEQEEKRDEDYYKRIDELLRQYSGKFKAPKEKPDKEKVSRFPKQKVQKPKKEFRFLKRAAQSE
ncbi:MAG: helix-turn-helix domain-containing protein [Roseburia sp.]|nr:helix-turn-helix domain-containing protein [Roseburia sp.]